MRGVCLAPFRRLLLAGVALTAVPLFPAAAQGADKSGAAIPSSTDMPADSKRGSAIEEIVVVARRREESIQIVPVAVTAVSGAVLKARGILNSADVQAIAPGLTISPAVTRETSNFTMRGQGELFGAGNPAVVSYFNEVPVIGGGASSLQLFDLASVQVLRGPQGTLFGRNTTGGAVLFEPNKPTDLLEGSLAARTGNFDYRELTAVVNVPVTEWLAVRVAGNLLRRGGYTKNLSGTGPDFDKRDSERLRVSVLMRPSDEIENLFIYRTERKRDSTPGTILTAFDPAGLVAGLYGPATRPFLGTTFAEEFAKQQALGPRKKFTAVDTSGKLTSYDLQDHLTVDTGPVTLKAIISYGKTHSRSTGDTDGIVLPVIDNVAPFQNQERFTGELQARGILFGGRLDWVVGLYHERFDYGPNRNINFLLYNPFIPSTVASNPRVAEGESNDRSKAAYGQIGFKLTDQLTVDVGARYTIDDRTFTDITYFGPNPAIPAGRCSAGGTPNPPSNCAVTFSGRFKKLTWNADLNYRPTPDILLYLATRRGYKSGGNNLFAIPPAPATFGPETITDVELGTKIDWRTGGVRGRFNLAAYYADYKDMQQAVSFGLSQAVVNVGEGATIKGFEAEASISPVAGLNFSGFLTFTDAGFKSGARKGVLFNNTPKWTYRLDATYTLPVADNIGDIRLIGSLNGRSSYAISPVSNVEPNTILDGYTLYDARIEWNRIVGSSFGLAVFGRNLANKTLIVGSGVHAFRSLGFQTAYFNEPRTYGVELTFDF